MKDSLRTLFFRPGIFTFGRMTLMHKPEAVLQVMAKCIVYDVKYNFYKQTFTYHAFCNDFDQVEVNEDIPEYYWTINSTNLICLKGRDPEIDYDKNSNTVYSANRNGY